MSKIRSLREHMVEKKATKYLLNALEVPLEEFRGIGVNERTKITESLRNFEESVSDRLQE